MSHDNPRPARRLIRLPDYDYAQFGPYFVTICTQGRACLFGEVRAGQMCLNRAGEMITAQWDELPRRFAGVVEDAFIVMPNHIHGILGIDNADGCEASCRPASVPSPDQPLGRRFGTETGSLSRVIQAFKSLTTNAYIDGVRHEGWLRFDGNLWQRGYYDHVIRSNRALDAIRQYIVTNPARWSDDFENPTGSGQDDVSVFARQMSRVIDAADVQEQIPKPLA